MSWPGSWINWLGPVRTATGGVLRHKVQAVAIGLVVLVSTASATLGLALLAASNTPFQHAFGAQDGAHVTVTVNAARASAAELAATGHLGGVTAAAGPFAESVVQTQFQGQPFGQLTLAGRGSPAGPVDDVVLNAGHWADGPGQVVLDGSPGGGGPGLGSTITVTGVPGTPVLTVVGFGNSVTSTADGWVTPGEITRLQPPGGPPSAQMLYRFSHAASYREVRADVAEVSRALPPGAVTGAASWLAAENQATGNGAIMEPFVLAFALIGLAMAVLIVGNVVSGAVVAGYQRIGVLKSVGLTPAQVVVAYLSRVGWPALAGCLAGVMAGNLLAIPVLNNSAGAYGVGSQQVPWWASVVAPAGMFALVLLAGFGPALRAGRLSAAEAIAAGRAPRAGRGYAPSGEPRMFGSTQTLPGLATPANLREYDVALRPGVSAAGYVQAVNGALGGRSPWQATVQHDGGKFYSIASALVGLLAIMVAVAAGLGVLNTVLMTTRDRVHDLGVFKALGMRPGQVLTMVVCWIAGPAVVAAAIAAPAAVALNAATVQAMAGTAHTGIPASFTQVFPPSRLALLSLAAVAIAVAGALLPASWAARARPAVALHAE